MNVHLSLTYICRLTELNPYCVVPIINPPIILKYYTLGVNLAPGIFASEK